MPKHRRAMTPVLAAAVLVMALVAPVPARAQPAPEPAAPRVVVSIAPLHSLVAAVMAGRAAPRLLLRAQVSPHDFALTPSDARALDGARLVVWTGPGLETALARPLAALVAADRRLAVAAIPGLTTWPLREGGPWEAAGEEPGHDHAAAGRAAIDPHLWLDPDNAVAIARAVAQRLAAIDPAHAQRYRANLSALGERIAALDRRLAGRLAPVRERPFIVFHDAFQYFERHYRLAGAGAVTLGPQRQPGARRLLALKARIRAAQVACVFAEPQFTPRLLATLTEGTGARSGILDPLGVGVEPGPALYETMMTRLADGFRACLGGG